MAGYREQRARDEALLAAAIAERTAAHRQRKAELAVTHRVKATTQTMTQIPKPGGDRG